MLLAVRHRSRAVRVGRVNGEFVVNPTHQQVADSDMNLTYVGNRELPLMIEGDAEEASEADILAAMKLAHESVVKLVDAQLELRKLLGIRLRSQGYCGQGLRFPTTEEGRAVRARQDTYLCV